MQQDKISILNCLLHEKKIKLFGFSNTATETDYVICTKFLSLLIFVPERTKWEYQGISLFNKSKLS